MDNADIYLRLTALAALDDPEFEIACTAEPELRMICNGTYKPGHQKHFNQFTDFLYMTRFNYYFDKSLLEFKELGMSWKEFYDRLTHLYKFVKNQLMPANIMALDNKLMELKILSKINKFPTELGANWAAYKGHLNVLEWMKENNLPLPNQLGANWAAKNGQINTLEWLASQNPPILPN